MFLHLSLPTSHDPLLTKHARLDHVGGEGGGHEHIYIYIDIYRYTHAYVCRGRCADLAA